MGILQLSHPLIVSIAENKTVCEPVAVGYKRGGIVPKSTISTDGCSGSNAKNANGNKSSHGN